VGGASKTVGYSKRIETFMTVQIIRIILYSNFQPHEAMFKAPLPPWERGLGWGFYAMDKKNALFISLKPI
jgi:hypothetical protein